MILSPAILKPPYIKGKNFLHDCIPIIKYGIPKYADSSRDPRVIGSPDWEKFWSDEIYKIINGVQAGGMYIPGRAYYYFNYKRMSTIKGVINPDVVDLHLELAYLIDYCKANGHNLMCPKGRRKGISEAATTMVIDYGWRFTEGYKAGVAAGNKQYITDFIDKWRFADSGLPPELSMKKLVDNDDEIMAGYSIKNQLGSYEEQGSKNTLYLRTMYTNPNMFKGLYLNDVVCEEMGEFDKWLEFYSASKDCLMNGHQQVGTMLSFGTAGNINKGSKDFRKAWNEAENFNFIKFMIPATRFYFYGGATEPTRQLPTASELYKKYKPYELIGCEDYLLSEKHILERRANFLKAGNLKQYNEDLQNNPLNETELFRKTSDNNFNIQKLNNQQIVIDQLEYRKYTNYSLEWVKNDKGELKMPLQVKAIPLKMDDSTDQFISIVDGEHPRKGYSNLYVSGLDGYDQDKAKASKSLGAMCIRIRANFINNAMQNAPIAVICCRPKRKEMFYDLCLKAAVYYNLIDNVLVDVGAALVMEYFREHGGWKYLAERPRKFESETSEQTHEKGVRLTNFSRPRMSSLMQADVEDNSHNYWFEELIKQLGNFDEIEVGSDNDLADAHGLSLMQDVSCDIKPRDNNSSKKDTRFDMPDFEMNGDGELLMKSDRIRLESDEQDHPDFGR
jgi:hypothetical protein